MTFSEFVDTYLNKINPATHMYWRTDDVISDSEESPETIHFYLSFAQQANLANVQQWGRPLSDAALKAQWISVYGKAKAPKN